jgi:hypothetical protein
MNEQHFAYKVRQHLNRGLREIHPETLDRLSAARRAALACQKQAVARPVLLAAGGHFSFHSRDLRLSQMLVAVAFLLCACYSTFWIADRRVQELGDIDSAILSGELPIGALTDKGFVTWLDSKSAE